MYFLPNIIGAIKSRRMRLTGHVARRKHVENVYIEGVGGTLEEWDHLDDLGIDGRVIGKWMLKEKYGRTWTEFIWLRIRSGGLL